MTDRELMQQALDVMEAAINAGDWKIDGACDPDWVLNALRARLAQPEEPNWSAAGFGKPQRKWFGLTDEDIEKLVYDIRSQTTGVVATAYVARAIEAKLKEKNHAI